MCYFKEENLFKKSFFFKHYLLEYDYPKILVLVLFFLMD